MCDFSSDEEETHAPIPTSKPKPAYRIPKKKPAPTPPADKPGPAPSTDKNPVAKPAPAPIYKPPERPQWTSRPAGPVLLDRRALKRQREQEALQEEHAARAQQRRDREAARRRAEEARLEAERREKAAAEKRARQEAQRAEESRRQFEILEAERIRDLDKQLRLLQQLVDLCQ